MKPRRSPAHALRSQTITLGSYRPPVFAVDCPRCNRRAEVNRADLLRRHGDISLQAVAQRIASNGGCALAVGNDPICSATAFELPVNQWADLNDALRGAGLEGSGVSDIWRR